MKQNFENKTRVLSTAHYITKEYNVSLFTQFYKPGRFLFETILPGYPTFNHFMLFAEEPVTVFTEPSFDVELHYLQIKNNIQPGTA